MKETKWWKRKICAHTIFSYHLVIFPEITQALNSYPLSDLKKISARCVLYQLLVLKHSEGSDTKWIVPVLKVRWNKSCNLYDLLSDPSASWLQFPKPPRLQVSAPGGTVSTIPDFLHSELILSQSLQNCRLCVGRWLLLYCVCLSKYLSL